MTLTILHAIPSLVGGGAERQLALLAPEMCRLGANVHVLYGRGGVNLKRLERTGVQLHPVGKGSNYDPRLFFDIVRLIRQINPDVVQTWLLQMDILAGLAAMATNSRFVLSERCSSESYTGTWKHRLRQAVGYRADLIIANSEKGASYWGGSPSPKLVIRNGVDENTSLTPPPLPPLDLNKLKRGRIILFAGRLVQQKNIKTLIQALEIVLQNKSDTTALLFGEGPLREDIEEQIKISNVSNRLVLYPYTENLFSWMKHASLFVSASLYEGHPNVVLEAAAVGCPLVISSIPEHREMFDETSAKFCNPQSPKDIANAISWVLDNPEDAQSLTVTAKQKVHKFTVEHAATKYLEAFRELCAK